MEVETESTTFRRPAIDESEEKNLSYQRKLPHDVAHLRERSGRGADDDLRALRRGGERECVSGNREAGVRRNDWSSTSSARQRDRADGFLGGPHLQAAVAVHRCGLAAMQQ